MELKQQIDIERLPQHIAVIMDGNGRWAKEHGKQRIFGHYAGVSSVRNVAEACAELGVKYLTLYAFSTENWNRPAMEVSGLMALFAKTIVEEIKTFQKNNIRLNAIGDFKSLPKSNYDLLMKTMEDTKNNDRMTMTLALSYSGRWEITNAMKNMALAVANAQLNPEDITQDTINAYLSTAGMPDPELLIRTSGEERISNFLLWQCAYSEFYYTDTLWPDFDEAEFDKALIAYQSRDRRFGGLSAK